MAKPSPSHEIIEHPIVGQVIRQRTRDTYIDATAMCQAAGKLFADYHRLGRTRRFLNALSAAMGIPIAELVQQVMGGSPHLQGTWVHPRVAVHLGQWLSPEFEVWITGIIEDWRQMQMLLRPTPTDWSKQVPDRIWQEIYRLHGWPWPGMSKNRYSVVGTIFVELVSDRIVAPGFSRAIELTIPRLSDGHHAVKMHQMLVETVGIPALQQHIGILLVLMNKQATWGGFMFAVNQLLPKVRRHLPRPDSSSSDQGELDV